MSCIEVLHPAQCTTCNRAAIERGSAGGLFVLLLFASQRSSLVMITVPTGAVVQVALLSISATACGLDFHNASSVVFAELPETSALLEQAEGRAWRNGCTFPVNSYVLLCQKTPDMRTWLRLSESVERTQLLMNDERKGACLSTL